jgi:hypothetical protein
MRYATRMLTRFMLACWLLGSAVSFAEESSEEALDGGADSAKEPTKPEPPISEKLMSGGGLVGYGVTAGAGLSISTAAFGGATLEQALPSLMPYVAIFPGAWFVRGDISKAYCSARYLAGPDGASAYADELARWKTRKALNRLKAGDTVTNEEVKEKTQWEMDLKGRCGLYTWLGAYVGKPTDFTANSTIDGVLKARDFASIASVGLISSPFTFLSAFVGVTFWSVPNDSTVNQITTTLTFGVGTNADIIGLLLN